MRKYQVISADGHLEVPIDWASRVPEKYKAMAPRLDHRVDADYWVMGEWEKKLVGQLYCGLRYDEFTREVASFYKHPDGTTRPGTGDAVQRLREQDQDGIDAEVLFYSVAGPHFLKNMRSKDAGCYLALVQAYNTFLAEFCSVAPDRLIGVVQLPESGVDDAIREMERCKKLGLRAAGLTSWPNGGPNPIPAEDDRFWAAALDLDMKMSPHVSFGGPIPIDPKVGMTPELVLVSGSYLPFAWTGTIGRLITQVLDRFPKLSFYFAETQAGWLPFALDWMDEFYLRWYSYYDIKLKKMPSQYYRDHFKFSFIQDRIAMKMRDEIGTDLLMWGSDFPHSIGTFPDTKKILDDLFADVPAAERRKVLVENPCAFFGLDPDKELTPTP